MSEIIACGPFIGLKRNDYGVILADPAWTFVRYSEVNNNGRGRAPQDHYQTMTPDEIVALPVNELAAPDCVLVLWTTWPHLPIAMRAIEAWGFTYKTCAFDWMKADVSTIDLFPEPKDADIKMGYWTRSNSEPALLATRGHPKRIDAGVRMGIIEKSREHSRKPDCVYGRIERLMGDVPKVELFARNTRSGWDSWGNQVGRHREVTA